MERLSRRDPVRRLLPVPGFKPLRLGNCLQEQLQSKFYELSRQLHPDRFARKPEPERQLALESSSFLNDAYRTLRDPVKRAEYVLKQQGFDIGEQRSKRCAAGTAGGSL